MTGEYKMTGVEELENVKADFTAWPVLVVTWKGAPKEADLALSLRAWQEALDRGEEFMLLVDARHLPMLSADQRKSTAELIIGNKEKMAQHQRGIAIIIRSTVVRGFVTAISWLSSPPTTIRFFSDRPDADRWCRQMLSA